MDSSQYQTEMGNLSSGGSLRSPQRKKLLTPYDKNFEQWLIDSSMPRRGERANLENWQELNTRLARRRPSLSETRFSDEDFRNFQLYSDNARNETEVISNLLPIFRRNSAIRPCQKRVFKNLTRLNSKIAAARPDFCDGSLPEILDFRVRNDLGDYILPSEGPNALLLPNFFLEIGGPQGDAEVLRLQVKQNLVYGARALLEIQSYSNGGRMYDGNAYTIGSIYDAGHSLLKFFTMYVTQPTDPVGQPTYHVITMRSFDLTQDAGTCRDRITWFRNSRDFAKVVRDGAIAHTNKTAHDQNEEASGSTLLIITLQSQALQVELLVSSPEVGRPHPKPKNPSSHMTLPPTQAKSHTRSQRVWWISLLRMQALRWGGADFCPGYRGS